MCEGDTMSDRHFISDSHVAALAQMLLIVLRQ
jgi:hypothetical protein